MIWMTEKALPQPRKRGVRDVIVAVVAAALIVSPSYMADILIKRFNLSLTPVAVFAVAVFLIGVYLMVDLLKS